MVRRTDEKRKRGNEKMTIYYRNTWENKEYTEITLEELQNKQNALRNDCTVIVLTKVDENGMYFDYEEFEC